jgi:hypothetical protein
MPRTIRFKGRGKRLLRPFPEPLALGGHRLVAFLPAAVVYVPFLQEAFSTSGLDARDWLLCAAVASSVLWLRELSKVITRAMGGDRSGTASARPSATERPDNARAYDRR